MIYSQKKKITNRYIWDEEKTFSILGPDPVPEGNTSTSGGRVSVVFKPPNGTYDSFRVYLAPKLEPGRVVEESIVNKADMDPDGTVSQWVAKSHGQTTCTVAGIQ